MPTLYVLGLPDWAEGDGERVEALRKAHDPVAARRLKAHVTLVFAQRVDGTTLIEHVRQVASRIGEISLIFRRAVVGTDHADRTGYAFLVPDGGNSALYALRDALHTGPLAGRDQPDIPFMPHVTVGRFPTPRIAADTCRQINAGLPPVAGLLRNISVAALHTDGAVETLAQARLRG